MARMAISCPWRRIHRWRSAIHMTNISCRWTNIESIWGKHLVTMSPFLYCFLFYLPTQFSTNFEQFSWPKTSMRPLRVHTINDLNKQKIHQNIHCFYSAARPNGRHRKHGVDQSGHSINEPLGGLVDYKNWTKITRYTRPHHSLSLSRDGSLTHPNIQRHCVWPGRSHPLRHPHLTLAFYHASFKGLIEPSPSSSQHLSFRIHCP